MDCNLLIQEIYKNLNCLTLYSKNEKVFELNMSYLANNVSYLTNVMTSKLKEYFQKLQKALTESSLMID